MKRTENYAKIRFKAASVNEGPCGNAAKKLTLARCRNPFFTTFSDN